MFVSGLGVVPDRKTSLGSCSACSSRLHPPHPPPTSAFRRTSRSRATLRSELGIRLLRSRCATAFFFPPSIWPAWRGKIEVRKQSCDVISHKLLDFAQIETGANNLTRKQGPVVALRGIKGFCLTNIHVDCVPVLFTESDRFNKRVSDRITLRRIHTNTNQAFRRFCFARI